MGATRKRTRSSSDSMPDLTSLGWASVRECPPMGEVPPRRRPSLKPDRSTGLLCKAVRNRDAESMSSWAVLLLPASITFVALYVTALRNRSDRKLIVLLVAGPAVAAIYFGLLVAFTNADDNGLWG